MLNVDLPQLEALATVIEEGSFDAAARRLHVTPSAISQRIKAFEIAAGAVLLQRSKPACVTEAGIPFLRLALQIRSLVAVATVESSDSDSVTIALAVNADSLNTWVLPALAGVSDRIDFDIRREDQDESAELLRKGIVMAAVTAAAEPVQGCSVTRLGVTRYRPMCTPAFRDTWFADGPSPQSLSRAPMIVFDRTDDLQDRYMDLWGGIVSRCTTELCSVVRRLLGSGPARHRLGRASPATDRGARDGRRSRRSRTRHWSFGHAVLAAVESEDRRARRSVCSYRVGRVGASRVSSHLLVRYPGGSTSDVL